MGLSASQARLLLLTARKSDLEYRAQQITNSLMILAQQTEEVARQYSIKISNQTIMYQSADKDQSTTKITASAIDDLATGGVFSLWVLDQESGEMKPWDESMGDYTGPEILDGMNNGYMEIRDADGKAINLSSTNNFVSTYYTDDDKAAEAEYNTKTASIQVKEKRLQNDLNQVQTQQSACDTEIDSVKKIMDKNIERTFKVFS